MTGSPCKSTLHILIVGAGLGGLLLAQALTKKGIAFEIFERDKSLHARFQGYAIGIQGIIDDIVKAVPDSLPSIDTVSHLQPLNLRPQLDFFIGGKKYVGEATDSPKVLFANRARLRAWLATGLDIRHGKKAVRIQEVDNGITVYFSDGSSARGDMLVGADGSGSFVRSHICRGNAALQTVPQGLIVGETKVEKEQLDRQLQLSHSACSIIGDGFRVFVALGWVEDDAQSATYQWFITWPDDYIAQDPASYWTAWASKKQLLDAALNIVKPLDDRLTEIIRTTKVEGMQSPPLAIRDLCLEELPVSRVTLLGDAGHAMAPFRGRGAFHAMVDAMKLSDLLAASTPQNAVSMLKSYQDNMLKRGSKAVRESRVVVQSTGALPMIWGHEVREAPWMSVDGIRHEKKL